MRLYFVQIDIFEAATRYAYPVVRHVMFGKTKEEAWKYVASHRASDAFLDGCAKSGRFRQVECRATVTEGWTSL